MVDGGLTREAAMNSSQRVMSGIQDLTGERRGSLVIERIASRRPLRWYVRCLNKECNLQTVVDHARLQNGAVRDCPNAQCGKEQAMPRTTLAKTGSRTDAVRSRDSRSALEYMREQAGIKQ